MDNKLFKFLCLILILFFAISSKAEVKLSAIFGNGMVLQRQADAAIWGKATPDATVEVNTSWNEQTYSTKAGNDGVWKLTVKTPEAGGPYEISLSDGDKVKKLSNVLIGEVWICSGQSNMEMPMKGFKNQPVWGGNKDIATSTNKQIRLFTVERALNEKPLYDFSGEWEECTPNHVANFSAIAYYFGRMMEEVLDVPVGLICTSWGGSRIESWMSAGSLKKFDFIDYGSPDNKYYAASNMFNAMLHPMIGFGIRGTIWFQGEANKEKPGEYEQLLPELIQDWRSRWGCGDFPFYFAQITPYGYDRGLNSAFMRQAMLNISESGIPNIGMACQMDLGEKTIIHAGNKKAGGERLAYWALNKTYGMKGIACEGPVLKEMKVEGNIVKLTFNHAKNGLTTYDKPLEHFWLAGENKRFFQATAVITGEGITLFAPRVADPVAVRYAFDDFVVGELYNTEGLPASSFRTDNWDN